MFGYVRPVMDKLGQEEQERFQEAYCGLCYELGRQYGVLARCMLNYDFTFLAILLESDGAALYKLSLPLQTLLQKGAVGYLSGRWKRRQMFQ